jgi:hypothetical protein
MTATRVAPFRHRRLSRGWEPIQLIGRMKILAARDGITLPPAWLLIQWMFLWENHRAPIPGFYLDLLVRILDRPLSTDVRTSTCVH